MANASGARHSLTKIREVTQGTTPSSPALKTVRNTGTGLKLEKTVITSAEITGNRNITDSRHGNYQVGGEIPCELTYGGAMDDLIEELLGGTWTVKATITGTDISAAAADNSYNQVAAGFV